jgi:hypothetical protein
MPTIPILYLKADRTGVSPANLVALEQHIVPVRHTRIIKLNFGPYFTDSLSLFSISADGTLTSLTRGTQYTCVDLLERTTQQFGKEVCGAILITDKTLPENFSATYQALGGPENADLLAVATTIERLNNTGEVIDWDDLLDKPRYFTPSPHLHDCLDLYGFEYLRDILQSIVPAVELSDDAMHVILSEEIKIAKKIILDNVDLMIIRISAHIANRSNPHRDNGLGIGLGKVNNFPIHTNYRLLYGPTLQQGSYFDTYYNLPTQVYVGNYSANGFVNESSALFKKTHWTQPVSPYTDLTSGIVKPLSGRAPQPNLLPNNYNEQKTGFYAEYRTYMLLNYNSCAAMLLCELVDYKSSLRRSGSIIRDQDIYSVPDQLPGLYCWLDFSDRKAVTTAADTTGVTIAKITDKSSHARTFNAASAENAPVFNKSQDFTDRTPGLSRGTVAQFTSGLHHLDLSSGTGITLKPGMTIITVTRAGPDNSSLYLLSEIGKQVGPDQGAFISLHGANKQAIVANASNATLLISSPNGSSKSNAAAITIASVSSTWASDCWTASSYPASVFTYPKGVQDALLPDAILAANYVGSSLNRLGLNQGAVAQQGEFAELLIYDRQLSKREVDAIVKYLRLKWSSALSLPMDLKFVQLAFQPTI